MRIAEAWTVGLVVTLAAAGGHAAVAAQPPAAGAYVEAQAAAGREAYAQSCAACHLDNLRGGFGPPLAGPSFTAAWGARSAGALLEYVRGTMPPGAEGSLGDAAYLNIVAYLLQANGHAAGAEPVRADSVRAVAPAAGRGVAAVAVAVDQLAPPTGGPPALVSRAVESYSLVTDEQLENPPDEEWLPWRRTPLGHGCTSIRRTVSPDVYAPSSGGALYVFALPE